MEKIGKMLLTLLAIVSVLGYTVFNYMNGKTDMPMMVVCFVILGIPFMNIVNLLIQELKNR